MAKTAFRVSGKSFELGAGSENWKLTVRPGGWIVAESPSGERRRFALNEVKGKLSASIGGRLLHGEIQARERGAGAGPSPESDLSAQFPGKVRKVLVTDGALVKGGEPLLLIEAMKMEFAVRAPGPGTVKRVLVREGQQLTPGDLFVEFEGKSSG